MKEAPHLFQYEACCRHGEMVEQEQEHTTALSDEGRREGRESTLDILDAHLSLVQQSAKVVQQLM